MQPSTLRIRVSWKGEIERQTRYGAGEENGTAARLLRGSDLLSRKGVVKSGRYREVLLGEGLDELDTEIGVRLGLDPEKFRKSAPLPQKQELGRAYL